ncbi:hypothetical protein L4D76_26540 [Photobacterium sagamiensis]
MLSDIRQDLAKYVDLYPAHSNKPPNMLRVLLNSPGFYVIASYRILYWMKMWQEASGSHLVKILFIGFRFITSIYWKIAMKITISNWPEIGPGLYLSNKGGIIIGPKRIGSGCVIHHNVTIGMNLDKEHPDIGNNVWIGSNSLIYGRIIKDGVIVQPGTVVGKNVPACVVIKGNPGTIVRRNIDNSSFLSNYAPNLEFE